MLGSDGQSYPCDGVVLAAGVWSAPLAAQLGYKIPIRPGKGYSVDFAPASFDLRTSLTLADAHVAITPLDGMVRVAGTIRDLARGDSQPDRSTSLARFRRAPRGSLTA